MKSRLALFITVAAFAFLSAGCKKDKAAAYLSIEGTWELRQASGMITINYPPGNGNKLKFSATGYEAYENGQPVKSGGYTIVEDSTVVANTCLNLPQGSFTMRIIYDNQPTAEKTFFELEANKLSFISGCYAYDAGHSLVYEKVAD